MRVRLDLKSAVELPEVRGSGSMVHVLLQTILLSVVAEVDADQRIYVSARERGEWCAFVVELPELPEGQGETDVLVGGTLLRACAARILEAHGGRVVSTCDGATRTIELWLPNL